MFVSSAGDGSAAPSVRDRLRDRVSLFTRLQSSSLISAGQIIIIIVDQVVNKSVSQILYLLLQTTT